MEVLEQGKKVIVSLSPPEVLFFHRSSQKSSRFKKFLWDLAWFSL